MTKHLGDISLLSLLPGSISDDAQIQAAASALSPLLQGTARAVPNLLLYARLSGQSALLPPLARLTEARSGLKPLSEAELELLAWQFHVDFREVARTNAELSAMIRNSIPWHRLKGTPASIKNALALFGYGVSSAQDAPSRAAGATQFPRKLRATASAVQDVRPSGIVIEENGPGPYWATYQLGLPQIATPEAVRHIVSICNEMAPARCRLWRIYTDAFDRRPIILSDGPILGDGWLSFHSGTSVDIPDSDGDVVVSFGTRNGYQSEQYLPGDVCGSFGSIIRLGFLVPYLDRLVVGRSRLSDVYPRNHGFTIHSLFSILWADRATTGRRWRGEWDARRWLDYTGFDRKLPPWRMEKRAISRSQLALSEGNDGINGSMGDINTRLGVTFAVIIDNPPRLGESRLSLHDSQRRELRLHEMFLAPRAASTLPVNPGVPHAAGMSALASTSPVANPHRVRQARHDACALHMQQREAFPPQEAVLLHRAAQSNSVAPCAAPPSALTSYRAPQWMGAWNEPGRTWTTPHKIATQ